MVLLSQKTLTLPSVVVSVVWLMVDNRFGLFCRGRTAGDEELNYQINSNPVNRSLCGKNHNVEGFI